MDILSNLFDAIRRNCYDEENKKILKQYGCTALEYFSRLTSKTHDALRYTYTRLADKISQIFERPYEFLIEKLLSTYFVLFFSYEILRVVHEAIVDSYKVNREESQNSSRT